MTPFLSSRVFFQYRTHLAGRLSPVQSTTGPNGDQETKESEKSEEKAQIPDKAQHDGRAEGGV